MKAAVFYGKQDIRVEDVPIREPQADEAVIQVACCGVCGTDLHIFHGDEGSAKTTPPTILGHEMAGTVVRVGSAVTRVASGDRVCVDPNLYCGQCYECRSGREHFCSGMIGVGTTVDGGFAQFCTLREKMLLPISDRLRFEDAAFAEPLACCLHGMDLTRVCPGDSVLILGGGTIGLIMVQLARLYGAAQVVLVEPEPAKRALGLSLGADLAFGPDESIAEACGRQGIGRFDRVVECVGKAQTVRSAIALASKGATVMLFGLTPPSATVEIHPFEIFQKELHITASFVNPYTQARAVELLAAGRVRVAPLIGEIVALADLTRVLTQERYRGLCKVLIRP